MSCSKPLKAWSTGLKTESGKPLYYITKSRANLVRVAHAEKSLGVHIPFNEDHVAASDGILYLKHSLDIPCGHCAACLAKRVRDWSVRLMLEASYYDSNYFLTLTYAPEHLPGDVQSVRSDISAFMKRLRDKFSEDKIRFFACIEYGTLTHRLHAHMILFNLNLDDLNLYSSGEDPLYISSTIDKLWKKGAVIIGSVTDRSCAYVARYCVKKMEDKDDSMVLMSRAPGIGHQFFKDNQDQILRTDTVYHQFSDNSHTASPPRYFDKICEKDFGLDGIKEYRKLKGLRKKATDIHLSGARNEDEYLAYVDSKERTKERRLKKRRVSI